MMFFAAIVFELSSETPERVSPRIVCGKTLAAVLVARKTHGEASQAWTASAAQAWEIPAPEVSLGWPGLRSEPASEGRTHESSPGAAGPAL